MVNEIITDWTTPAGGGFASVMYFDDGVSTLAAQREALSVMWEFIDNELTNQCTWSIRTEGRVFSPTTGNLSAVWQENTNQSGAGTDAASTAAPDAAQLLIRWRTGVVAGNRLLQGRTFIPGSVVANVAGGNVATSTINQVNTGINSLITANVGFGIWHRPVNGGGGVFGTAVSGSCWSEWAVLRRRRNS